MKAPLSYQAALGDLSGYLLMLPEPQRAAAFARLEALVELREIGEARLAHARYEAATWRRKCLDERRRVADHARLLTAGRVPGVG